MDRYFESIDRQLEVEHMPDNVLDYFQRMINNRLRACFTDLDAIVEERRHRYGTDTQTESDPDAGQ